jgi:hypothetical protein
VWGTARSGGEEGGGVRLASEAHIGVEPEATAWSATSTGCAGAERWWGGSHVARAERERGVWWGAVAAQADLVRKVGPVARRA